MDVRTEMLVFPEIRGPDRSFCPRTSAGISAWTSAGYPAPKLTLWAAFSFLNILEVVPLSATHTSNAAWLAISTWISTHVAQLQHLTCESQQVLQSFSVATSAEPRGEQKNSLCKFWAVKKIRAGENFLSGERGLLFFFFFFPFARFSNNYSYQYKNVSGAVSFCRSAALTIVLWVWHVRAESTIMWFAKKLTTKFFPEIFKKQIFCVSMCAIGCLKSRRHFVCNGRFQFPEGPPLLV